MTIEIPLDYIQEGLILFITEKKDYTLFKITEEEAFDNNEAVYQLTEGCFYDYEFSDASFKFKADNWNITQPHSRKPNLGIIAPNIYVGTLRLSILSEGQQRGKLNLEVRSVKTSYRQDYRDMLEYITEKCTDLLLRANSPVTQGLEIDPNTDSQTLYQRFTFIRSIIDTDEFREAIHRINTHPVTRWVTTEETKNINQVRRFNRSNIRQLIHGTNRLVLPSNHHLRNLGFNSISAKINDYNKIDSLDTPENRFIKYALDHFLYFITEINQISLKEGYQQLIGESQKLSLELETHLNSPLFQQVSPPQSLNINSPALQRKEGYREVLRVWLLFDLAAKLVWQGGEDVFEGGKKDVAVLYEYWLFFKLLDLLEEIFEISPLDIENILDSSNDGLSLKIKQGKFYPLHGIYIHQSRKLHIKFSYNRSFSGKKKHPKAGSWTVSMRPDYTLTIWPFGINEETAEREELIVHIHFDAKYKVENLRISSDSEQEDDLNNEKDENRKGIYKNADLLKMHSYKDAIRRTGGAYVLYPGDDSLTEQGFHEIIPGLGAFPVKPSKTESGIGHLKSFINGVVNHFLNRTSQREKFALSTYLVHKERPDSSNELRAQLPEAYGERRDLLPETTNVLIGYYRSQEHLEWINDEKLYNFRTGDGRGALPLNDKTVSAKYLLVHTSGDNSSNRLYEIISNAPVIYSREELLAKNYPFPSQDFYLVVEIRPVEDSEFEGVSWNFRNLQNYRSGRASSLPFTTTLAELMKNVHQE